MVSGKTVFQVEVECWWAGGNGRSGHSWGRAGHVPVPCSTCPGPGQVGGKQPEGAFAQVTHHLPLSFPPWGNAPAANT